MLQMRHRKLSWLASGLAVAAIVVPTAQASVDEGLGYQPPKASVTTDDLTRLYGEAEAVGPTSQRLKALEIQSEALNQRYGVGQSDRIENVRVQPRETTSPTDAIENVRVQPRETAGPTDAIENVRVQPRDFSAPQSVTATGFDWGDAGIGAGVALGAILMAAAAAMGARHFGGRPTTA